MSKRVMLFNNVIADKILCMRMKQFSGGGLAGRGLSQQK